MTIMPARIIHIAIECHWIDVWAFASNPENIASWASGLASGLIRDGEDWLGDGGPIGRIRVRFAPPNPFGILDHTVTLEDGTAVFNPMRVVQNGNGALVTFTLFHRPDQDTAALDADAAHILRDLTRLKTLMENGV
jgi:hypothetical protein